jgi:hypothetical protein
MVCFGEHGRYVCILPKWAVRYRTFGVYLNVIDTRNVILMRHKEHLYSTPLVLGISSPPVRSIA